MAKPRMFNVACQNEKCTKPLFDIEVTKDKGIGIHSYGAFVKFDPLDKAKAFAICPGCGTKTPFDGRLMPH